MNAIAINILTHTVSAFLAFLLIFLFLGFMKSAQMKATTAAGGCGCGGHSAPASGAGAAPIVYDPSAMFTIN